MRKAQTKSLNLKGGAHSRFFKKVICGILATLCISSTMMVSTYAADIPTTNSQPEEKYYFIMKIDQNGSYIYEMITETEYNIYIQNLNK